MNEPTSPVVKSDAEWQAQLTPLQYDVLRRAGTEAPGSGEYVHSQEKGMYLCAACGNELFSSDTKFDSGTGWPSFDKPHNWENITMHEDGSLGMQRIAVTCQRCGGHLGHLFPDGPTDTGQRFCINSAALDLQKAD